MDDDESFAWPGDEERDRDSTDDEDVQTVASEETSTIDSAASEPEDIDEATSVGASDATPEASSEEPVEPETVDVSEAGKAEEAWTFPVRAAPILALQGEDVVEFPLSQHLSGTESTSLVMDDHLMRIVEARYDSDGVRRLNVRMALVKEHISGYSHAHLDLFQKLRPVWWGAIGFGLVMATSFVQGLLAVGGGAFVLTGVAGLLMAQLDLHRISFSDHGGRHDFYLSGWRQEPYLIHNSTALLGPAFVDFLRTSEFDTQHIDAVLEAMRVRAQPAPVPAPPAEPALPAPPNVSPSLPLPPTPMTIVQDAPAPAAASGGPPISTEQGGPPPALPPPPTAVLPPPVNPQPTPPPPTMAPAPLPTPAPPVQLPPAPLPMAPLPPPPMPASQVDEDALWNDLS